MHTHSPLWLALLACLAPLSLTAQSPRSVTKKLPLKGEVFTVEGRTAFLILPPKQKSKGPIPWVWYAPTLPRLPSKAEKWMFDKFVAAGMAIAGVDVGESNGSPAGRAIYSALHQELVKKRGLTKRACLLARSRGGLMLYNWAVENPASVACIAGIYPVCNLSSWPGLARACGAYGMNETELAKSLRAHNPIDRLAPLAKAKVPIFHIHGDRDGTVPLAQNSGELKKRYTRLRGPMVLEVVKGQGHNMWRGWFESQKLVDFVIKHARLQRKKPKKKGYTYVIPFDKIPPAPALTPKQALKSFKLHEDFEISVVASDPMIQSPVAIRFDGDGRMWVVEMRAYMLNAKGEGEERPIGRISILTDTDQDGVFDDYKVFLDGLVLPRAITFYKNGILYGGHRKLYFVENVHDKAGKRTVIDEHYTANQNVEHRSNGLLRGLDNWIYNVKSDARYREVDGKWVKERTTYRGQWGMSQDNYGRLYYNENWFGMKADQLMPNALMRNTNSTKRMGDTVTLSYRDRVFPARITPGVNRGGEGAIDDKGYLTAVTAACGPVCYRGDQFPKRFRNTAFFCEPSAHFVRMLDLTSTDGLTAGKHALKNREFLASTDERFRPVNLCNAPDGSLFLVDLYHGVLQHKAYLTRYLREHVKHRNLESNPRLGRVYRIHYRDNKLGAQPRMLKKSAAELVTHLAHPNGWWRDTAQQMIIDRQDRSVVSALNALASDQGKPLGQIHALWTLEGLAAINITAISAALQSENPRVLEMAIRLSESLTGASDVKRLIPRFVGLAKRTEAVVLRQLAASLGRFPGDEALALLGEILGKNIHRKFFREVAIHGLAGREGRFEELLGSGFSDKKFRAYLQDCLSIKTTAAAHPLPRNKNHLASFRRGEKMFITNCMACHGPDGKGLAMLGPPLVKSEWTTGTKSRVAAILLQGMMGPIKVDGKEYIPAAAMPGLKENPDIGDKQLADVATFIRFAWGNKKGAVSPKLFATIRKTLKNRDTAFSADELRKRYPK